MISFELFTGGCVCVSLFQIIVDPLELLSGFCGMVEGFLGPVEVWKLTECKQGCMETKQMANM